MGKQYSQLSDELTQFIQQQKLFFVATATADSKINLSPKGLDSLRVLDDKRVIWLNLTGSGNETAAHVQQHPRMTIMFCAFEGAPMILRLYGQAKVVHQGDDAWSEIASHFPETPGVRQIFDLSIDMVQTSCGFGVPLFDYVGDRDTLTSWATKKGTQGIHDYWRDKNQVSLDGIPTHIVEKGIVESCK